MGQKRESRDQGREDIIKSLIIRPISALTPPPFPFYLFLPSAINCIQDYYYLILSLLYICIALLVYALLLYLVFYVVKRLRVIFIIAEFV
jgi:hypothetical protein